MHTPLIANDSDFQKKKYNLYLVLEVYKIICCACI